MSSRHVTRTGPFVAAIAALAAFCGDASAQATRYVDFRATGAGSGTSWTDAFTNLHAALTAAVSGDTIRIAQGTYTPDVGHPSLPIGDRLAYWTYKAGVQINGGYRGLGGGGGSPDDRNTTTLATVLSGEIGDAGSIEDNSNTLLRANVAGQILLDGLTFTKVYQDNNALVQQHYGSALWTFGSAGITMNDCVFINNTTIISSYQPGYGGTTFIFGTPGTISNCRWITNHIGGTQFQTVAAGLFIWQADLQITGCLFEGNVNDASGGASYAGALYIEHGFPVISNTTFRNNSSVSGGGAVFHRNAWAPPPSSLSTRAGAPTFINCRFENNSSNQGGALWLWSRREDDLSKVVDCTFVNNHSGQNGAAVFVNPGGTTWMQVQLTSSLFSGNTAGFATFATCFDGAAETTITNCTFAANSAGRAVAASGESLTVANSIFRGPGAGQPLLWAGGITGHADRCDIEGLAPASVVTTNIISADPLFVNAAGGDFRLGPGSPCIDAGDNSLVPAGLTTDALGSTRFVDIPTAADTGVGTAPIIDLGALETQLPPCPADYDHNGQIEPADIAAFVNVWFTSLSGGTLAGDFDNNGAVEPADVAAFVTAWFAALSGGC